MDHHLFECWHRNINGLLPINIILKSIRDYAHSNYQINSFPIQVLKHPFHSKQVHVHIFQKKKKHDTKVGPRPFFPHQNDRTTLTHSTLVNQAHTVKIVYGLGYKSKSTKFLISTPKVSVRIHKHPRVSLMKA